MQQADGNPGAGRQSVRHVREHDFEHAARKGKDAGREHDARIYELPRKEQGHETVKQKPRKTHGGSGDRQLFQRTLVDKKEQKQIRAYLRGKIDRRQKPETYERKSVQLDKGHE